MVPGLRWKEEEPETGFTMGEPMVEANTTYMPVDTTLWRRELSRESGWALNCFVCPSVEMDSLRRTSDPQIELRTKGKYSWDFTEISGERVTFFYDFTKDILINLV